MSFYNSIINLFTKNNDEDYDDEYYFDDEVRCTTSNQGIGRLDKNPVFKDLDLLIENQNFIRAVDRIFGTPTFMIKLHSNKVDGEFIEIPVENIFNGKANNDISTIRINKRAISFITMRPDDPTIKDDGTVVEVKRKVEEIIYDFKGLPRNKYPEEVDREVLGLLVPYAKIAYFTELLLQYGLIKQDYAVTVKGSNPDGNCGEYFDFSKKENK